MKQSGETTWIEYIRNKMSTASCKGTSQYQQLADAFLSAIDAGVLPAGTRLPPDAKLAEEIGYSHITLGRALNELRKMDIVERSRTHGTSIAVHPEAKLEPHSRTVAILFDDIQLQSFNTGLFQQLYLYLSQKGYKILFFSAGGSGQEQSEQLIDLMKRRQCAGAVVWSIMNREQTGRVMAVKPAFWPLVFVNTMFNPEDIAADTVVFDNFSGFREIALHYWRNTGRKVIFATLSYLLEDSLHKEYLAEIKKAIGAENVKVFAWDRDPVSRVVNRKDHTLLLTFESFSSQYEWAKINRFGNLEPCVLSYAGVEAPEDGKIYLFSCLSELSQKAVALLDRRLKSPQCAYRHQRTSYRLLNFDKCFPNNQAGQTVEAGKGAK